jgi:hypothetical protein
MPSDTRTKAVALRPAALARRWWAACLTSARRVSHAYPRRALGVAALLPFLAASAAYQVARPLEVAADTPLLGAWLFEDVHAGEGDERWTRARSQVLLPEPGPDLVARVEVDVSGWRPRGQPPPRLVLEAGPGHLIAQPQASRETLSFPSATAGWWSSTLSLQLRSDTFVPGTGDARALGVRLHAVRLIPQGPTLALRRPPLRPLVWAALCGLLVFLALARATPARQRRAHGAALVFALVLGCLLVWARPYAVLGLPGLAVLLAGLVAWRALAPRTWSQRPRRAWAHATLGLRALGQRASLIALVLGLTAFTLAERTWRVLEIDPTTAAGLALTRGLGAFDAQDGQRLRHVRRGAQVALGALGAGDALVELRVAAPRPHPALALGTWGTTEALAAVATSWTWVTLPASTSGRTLTFGLAAEQAGLRLASLRLTRRTVWPAWQALVALLLAALSIGALLGSAGRAHAAAYGMLAFLLGSAVAVARAPLATLPFLPTLAALCACGWLLALWLRSGMTPGDAGRPRHVVAALSFVAWACALTFPLYRGGHFLFHSAIAREIWQGRFLTYYLPSPDSMLARQAQWGNVVVPHPCLYHTLAAPLAALPEAWFHLSEKLLLAGLLTSLVLVAGRLAEHLAGARAELCAALLVAAAVPGFQLLGLGHLMTLLGCATGAWALALLAERWPDLGERWTFWRLVALLTLGLLAYTATLLFLSVSVAFLVLAYWRSQPARARRLALAWLAAASLAFGAYYVHWTLPFLRDSLPHLLAGAQPVAPASMNTAGPDETSGTSPAPPAASNTRDLGRRALAQPGKLDYSFGSWLVPVLGWLGLVLTPRAARRDVLLAWAALLPAFIGVDLFFNLLLKHHYFTMVPLCVGAGLLLARLLARGPWLRALAAALLAAHVALGLDTAIAVTTGRIP